MIESYRGKKVLVTGHTGFKGSWLCEWLLALGAEVHGFALEPPTRPSLFNQLKLAKRIASHKIGDVRDLDLLVRTMRRVKPDFVFHLAAQPLVRLSYEKPAETFDTNVMGTVNVLEAARRIGHQISVVCITTDKVYENNEKGRPFRETDPFGGHDPYSASKGACEIVISSYRRSFFGTPDSSVWVASARAGNVIGGGDWAKDRIVPDAMRALAKGEVIPVRNKISTRPWQNFGPDPKANRTVKELVEEMLKWREGRWVDKSDPHAVHEAGLLNLDIRKARKVLGWKPRWDFEETVKNTVQWYAAVADGRNPLAITRDQIAAYGF